MEKRFSSVANVIHNDNARLLCTKPTIMKMPPAIKHFSQRRRRSLEPIQYHNPFLLMKSLIVCTMSPDACETESKWNVEKKLSKKQNEENWDMSVFKQFITLHRLKWAVDTITLIVGWHSRIISIELTPRSIDELEDKTHTPKNPMNFIENYLQNGIFNALKSNWNSNIASFGCFHLQFLFLFLFTKFQCNFYTFH